MVKTEQKPPLRKKSHLKSRVTKFLPSQYPEVPRVVVSTLDRETPELPDSTIETEREVVERRVNSIDMNPVTTKPQGLVTPRRFQQRASRNMSVLHETSNVGAATTRPTSNMSMNSGCNTQRTQKYQHRYYNSSVL